MAELAWLDLSTTDAAFNLAAEQYIFDCLPRDRRYFMLWQNRSAIIIGKYQNTLAEINAPFVEEQGFRWCAGSPGAARSTTISGT